MFFRTLGNWLPTPPDRAVGLDAPSAGTMSLSPGAAPPTVQDRAAAQGIEAGSREPMSERMSPDQPATPPQRPRQARRADWKKVARFAIPVAVAVAAYMYVVAPTPVEVARVTTVTATETLGATGKVRGERVADLGLDVSGVVRDVYVHEGDSMSANRVMLSLDKTELDARTQSARAAVASARAELDKAGRPPLPSEVRQARAELAQAREVGQARVQQARARLRDLEAGTNPEEIAAAEAELRSRREQFAKSETDFKRSQSLVREGALSQSALDDTRTSMETARAALTAQTERVKLLKSGARIEQLAEARAALSEAIAGRDNSVTSAAEKLNTILAQPRIEDVRSAQAKVDEAQSELDRTQEARARSDLRAPFAGVVADLLVERGQSVSPGQKLMVFHEFSRPVIEVETDEANLSALRIGQKAVVTSDAYPSRSLRAVLHDLGSRVDPERGTVQIELRPVRRAEWLRPDLTVDVNIITRGGVNRMIVPADAITRYGRKTSVLVIRGGRAMPVAVVTGAVGPRGIAVVGNLREDELVIRNADSVTPNSEVRPVVKR